jgi:hypothetical protein
LALVWRDDPWLKPYPFLVELQLVVILFFEIVLIPLEFLQQQKAPPAVQIDKSPDLIQNGPNILKYFFKGQNLIRVDFVSSRIAARMVTLIFIRLAVVVLLIVFVLHVVSSVVLVFVVVVLFHLGLLPDCIIKLIAKRGKGL